MNRILLTTRQSANRSEKCLSYVFLKKRSWEGHPCEYSRSRSQAIRQFGAGFSLTDRQFTKPGKRLSTMTRKPLLPLLCGLVITLTLANAADAGSLTYVVPIDTLTQPGYLPEFDPMQGTLLSVGFVANVTAAGDFYFEDAVSSVDVYASVSFYGVTPTDTLISLGSVFGFATEDFSTPENFVSASVNIDSAYFLPAASFYGTDMLNVQAVPNVGVAAGGVGGQPIGLASADGSLTVTYTFGVPEPSSLLIATSAAVVLFGYSLWRRVRSAA